MSLNSMSNYEPLEIILFKTVLIFLRAGLLAVIRKNINLSEFLSKLGRFVCATFELRLRNIDKDSSWGRCQPIFIQEIGPTFCLYKKSERLIVYIKSRNYYLL